MRNSSTVQFQAGSVILPELKFQGTPLNLISDFWWYLAPSASAGRVYPRMLIKNFETFRLFYDS